MQTIGVIVAIVVVLIAIGLLISVAAWLFLIAVIGITVLWSVIFVSTGSHWSQFAVWGHFGMPIGLSLILIAALFHLPKIAAPLSRKQRVLVFGAWVISSIVFITSYNNTLDTYYQTPEGRKELAKINAERDNTEKIDDVTDPIIPELSSSKPVDDDNDDRTPKSCFSRGIEYYKEIGSYPTLHSYPNAGVRTEDYVAEVCSNAPYAYGGLKNY